MDNQWTRQQAQTPFPFVTPPPPLPTPTTMAATLPPLEPLFKRGAKRTWDVFASEIDAGLKDEEER